MSERIIGLQDWMAGAPGQHLMAWERAQFDHAVADLFGYHALQLGLPSLRALATNRMPHRWLATQDEHMPLAGEPVASLLTDFAALPFAQSSLDLVVMPHTLDGHANPHATLREVARVLVPDGRVVISGFNPTSLWGMRFQRERLSRRWRKGPTLLPSLDKTIGYGRLRDWLHLLDFDIEVGRFGVYGPVMGSETWQRRFSWMDRLGARWWPIFGAAYFLVAVKRVHGVRLLETKWKTVKQRANAPVPLANRHSEATLAHQLEEDSGFEPR